MTRLGQQSVRCDDAESAAARSRRWRAATQIEDQLALVEARIFEQQAEPGAARDETALHALEHQARRLRAMHARLVALEGLTWPLRDDAHAEVLAAMQRASDLLAKTTQDHGIARTIAAEFADLVNRGDIGSQWA